MSTGTLRTSRCGGLVDGPESRLRDHFENARDNLAPGQRIKYYIHKRLRGYVLHVRSGVVTKLERSEWNELMIQTWCDA